MSSLYCLFSDFECRLWPLLAFSVKVIQCKVPLFFIGLAVLKMAFLCQAIPFCDTLASCSCHILEQLLKTFELFFRFVHVRPYFNFDKRRMNIKSCLSPMADQVKTKMSETLPQLRARMTIFTVMQALSAENFLQILNL